MVTLSGGTNAQVLPVQPPVNRLVAGFRPFETSQRLIKRTPDDSVAAVGIALPALATLSRRASSPPLALVIKELVERLAPCDHPKLSASQFFYDLQPLFKILDLSR